MRLPYQMEKSDNFWFILTTDDKQDVQIKAHSIESIKCHWNSTTKHTNQKLNIACLRSKILMQPLVLFQPKTEANQCVYSDLITHAPPFFLSN